MLRTVALCGNKLIGIESIYTVVDGKQINIPDKLRELRIKSKNNKLFCPCGCKRNLILVAGDKNLRKQHFREKVGTGKNKCSMPQESNLSIKSKIVLKCWLEDKLKTDDIVSEVAININGKMGKTPEFTLCSEKKSFAVRYWRFRNNIDNDRLNVIEKNSLGMKIMYIVDKLNGGTNGQYPEALMKLQEKQKYCLLLSVDTDVYEEALLKAVFYEKNVDGLWQEKVLAEGTLQSFSVDENCRITFNGATLESLLEDIQSNKMKEEEKDKFKISFISTAGDNFGTIDRNFSGYKRQPLDVNIKRCPRCKAKLKKCKGIYGPFWGCSNYPKCEYSESIRSKYVKKYWY